MKRGQDVENRLNIKVIPIKEAFERMADAGGGSGGDGVQLRKQVEEEVKLV